MALIRYDWCPYKKRERHQECTHREKKPWKDTKRRKPSASQGEALGETKPANILVLDF